MTPSSRLLAVLDLARWAPSGDNTQPWRFEVLGERLLRIHLDAPDPAHPDEFRGGAPTLLAGGALLESLRVAARADGWTIDWHVEPDAPRWRIVVQFRDASPGADSPSAEEPGVATLLLRSVARGPLGARPLTATQKARLAAALGPELEVTWHDSMASRLRMGRLGAIATDIRLRAPETFDVHRQVVDWRHPRSPDGLPVGAIGLDRPTLAIMRWAMRDWGRMQRLNRLFGTWTAQLQLDLRPAFASAAFFVVRVRTRDDGALRVRTRDDGALRVRTRHDDVLRVRTRDDGAEATLRHGMALQRFWLVAEVLGLAMQPALATLAFAHYGRHGTAFIADATLRARAAQLATRLEAVAGDPDALVFLGRLGQRRPGLPGPRSVRRPLEELLLPASPQA